MSDMIGQEAIKGLLKEFVKNNTLPQFILLEGKKGQGKYTLAHYLGKLLKCSIYEPKELKVDDMRLLIEDSLSLPEKRLYIIRNAEELTPQAQNAILKFAEEPPTRAYLIMTVSDIRRILPTIKSRARIIKMQPYNQDELKSKEKDALLLKLCSNFGEIEEWKKINYKGLYEYCIKVRDNIGKAAAGNLLNIVKDIDGENSYTAEQFLDMLQYTFSENMNPKTLYIFQAINKAREQLSKKGIIRIAVMDTCLQEIREIVRGNNR